MLDYAEAKWVEFHAIVFVHCLRCLANPQCQIKKKEKKLYAGAEVEIESLRRTLTCHEVDPYQGNHELLYRLLQGLHHCHQ